MRDREKADNISSKLRAETELRHKGLHNVEELRAKTLLMREKKPKSVIWRGVDSD